MNDADLEGIELENIIVGHRRTRPTQRFTPPPNDGPFIDDVDPAPIRPAGNGSWAPNFNPPPDLEAEQQHSDGGYHDGNGSRAPNFNSPRDLEGEQEDYDIGHQDGNDDVNEDDPAESVDDDNEAILEYQKDLPSMTLSTAARTMARRMMMTTTPPPILMMTAMIIKMLSRAAKPVKLPWSVIFNIIAINIIQSVGWKRMMITMPLYEQLTLRHLCYLHISLPDIT
jgi:hypothetical protein